jgi:tripartite-type tricarboxylate transporter receptor subunit TctC
VWFNEGQAQLCEQINGFGMPHAPTFLLLPDTQLNDWPDIEQSQAYYGHVQLFLELADALRDRRLRQADAARGGTQAAALHHGDEVANLAESHETNSAITEGYLGASNGILRREAAAVSTADMRHYLFALLLAVGSTAAQVSKPVRIITGAPPGTPGDVSVRIVADPLAAALGQPVLVENRPGAIGTIGLGVVAKAAPDGQTLGTFTLPSTVAQSLLAKMPYDTVSAFAAVRQLTWVSNVLVVRSSVPLKSLPELVAAAKAKPQHFTFASGGNGTPAHVAAELFRLSAGIEMRHVPYNGAVAGVAAVMGDQIDMMFAIAPAVIGHIRSGKLRALATPAPSRIPVLPEVPTLMELGYAVDVRDWTGIVAPAGTPSNVVARLDDALASVLAQKEVKERLAAAGFEQAESGADAFAVLIRNEVQKWARVVREAGIKPD